MERFFERLDPLAEIGSSTPVARWLERLAFVLLMLMVVSAPHSIAASQASWLLGLTASVVRLFVRPRPKMRFKALDLALWAFVLWAFVSSLFSYEPAVSLDKLRGVGLFLVFYFVYYNVRRLRAVYFLAFALIFSCMFNVVWVIAERAVGRGVEIHDVARDGPLGKAGLIDGATILAANGERLNTLDELIKQLEQNETVKIRVYQYDAYTLVDLKSDDLLPGNVAEQRLGISEWSRSYNWRAQGFFSHFTTYAEVLQLIASLLFGLIVAGLGGQGTRQRAVNSRLAFLSSTPVMIVALAAICIALLLTVTRASQLAFMISAFSIVVISGNRKLLLAAGLIAIPVILGGLIFLQETRNVGLLDTRDESTLYRLTMWKDGMRLSTASARNFVFGIGMDSTKLHWQEWGMFDGGRMPMGHFHSTPVQLLVERGAPALLIWLAVVGIYAKTLWRGLNGERESGEVEKWAFGILLGCLGAVIGFFVSGLVHYNLGDGEVAMVFYLLMAIGVRTTELLGSTDDDEAAAAGQMRYRMAA